MRWQQRFYALSRSRQIAICVFLAHVAFLIILVLHHMVTYHPSVKKPIVVRTMLLPQQHKTTIKQAAIGQKKQQNKREKAADLIPISKKNPSFDTGILEEISTSLDVLTKPIQKQRLKSELFLPSILEIKTSNEQEPSYGKAVAAILHNELVLPEFGEVVACININTNGVVVGCEILDEKSHQNGEFLKKRLQELAFPCFNEFGLSVNQINFTITFRNVENFR